MISEHEPFEVILENSGKPTEGEETRRIFDPRQWELIGVHERTEGGIPGDMPDWLYVERLYGDGKTTWIEVSRRIHCGADWADVPRLRLLSADIAAEWVYENDIPCPLGLVDLRSQRTISPSDICELFEASGAASGVGLSEGADHQTIEASLEADSRDATNPSPATEFRWTVPMLEGYVFDLLNEVKYPTERKAVAGIAAKARKREPSRATLRKTYAWQNRTQKTPKPRTTTEAQSGVSPARNADAGMSHEEATHAVLDIEEKLRRQLTDDERAAVAWTLQQAEPGEDDEAIAHLIHGFRSGDT